MNVDRNSVMRKENTVEDQDRKTPEEEAEVEGHSLRDVEDVEDLAKKDDDFEAHALRDAQEAQEALRGDDKEALDIQ
jgi:hypothetical protein